MGARIIWYCVHGLCVDQWAQGKKITPSIRWEVPGEVSSVGKWELDGARKRVGKLAGWMECAWENDFKLFAFGYGMHVYIVY